MILVNKCYSIITPESAEEGDIADSGMVFEDSAYSFRDLVNELREYSECSCSPAIGATYEWVTSEGDIDYRTAEETQYSLHYSRNNPPRNARYWRLALTAAGFVRVRGQA